MSARLDRGFAAGGNRMYAIAEKPEGYVPREVKVGVVQLAGFALEPAERFLQQAVEDRPDVVVLPEIGCGREPQALDRSPILDAVRPYAARGEMYVVVDLIEARDPRPLNTTVILDRRGEVAGLYRKVHIPLPTDSDGGDSFPVFDLDFGRTGILVCFDNYFPEAARSLALQGAEIIFYPHQEHYCWNGVEHIEILSRARAIENVIYVVSSGPTAAEEGPFGRTAVIDPTGEYLLKLGPDEEGYGSVTIDLGLIERVLIDDGPVPMREQMLVDDAVRPGRGRRRSETYRT